MRVTLNSNTGEGTTQTLDVSPGTIVRDFLDDQNLNDPSRFTVRVNNRAVDLDTEVLQDGDRISVTPLKVAGATTH